MHALKCDRCGKYYDTEENQLISVRERGHESMDLCDDCYTHLVTWLNELKPAPEPETPDEPETPTEPTTDPTEPQSDPTTDPTTEPTTDPSTPTDPEGGDDNNG